MNRSERRRFKQKEKEPVINIKASDVENIRTKAVNDAIDTAFVLMLGIPIMVLHDKYHFGKKRGPIFVDQVLELYDSYEKGFLSLDDIKSVLKDETGIEVKRE